MLIFVLFKHKLYRKIAVDGGIQCRIGGVESKHADHLTTNHHGPCEEIFLVRFASYFGIKFLLKLMIAISKKEIKQLGPAVVLRWSPLVQRSARPLRLSRPRRPFSVKFSRKKLISHARPKDEGHDGRSLSNLKKAFPPKNDFTLKA